MPWRIKSSTNIRDPKNPVIHMFDGSVNVHLLTHLDSGVVDLWIGDNVPVSATVYITIDSERTPIVKLEETTKQPTALDLSVIRTVLTSLGINHQQLLTPFRRIRPTNFRSPRPNTGARPANLRSNGRA